MFFPKFGKFVVAPRWICAPKKIKGRGWGVAADQSQLIITSKNFQFLPFLFLGSLPLGGFVC